MLLPLQEKADTKQEPNALSHITRDILQQCSEEFRPGPEPLGRQDMRIGYKNRLVTNEAPSGHSLVAFEVS